MEKTPIEAQIVSTPDLTKPLTKEEEKRKRLADNHNRWLAKNRERVNAQKMQRYHNRTPEQIAARKAKQEKINARQREIYAQKLANMTPEELAEKQAKEQEKNRIHREKNREKLLAQSREKYYSPEMQERRAQPDYKDKRLAQDRQRRHCTWQGFHQTTWGNINKRTINGNKPNWKSKWARSYLEKGIELRMTLEQYREFCAERKDLIEQMQKHGLRPSIDRIDHLGHYEVSNLQIIPHIDNCRKINPSNKAKPE